MLFNKFSVASFAYCIVLGHSAPIARTDQDARTISPTSRSDLCLQLRCHVFLDNNYVNYLTFRPCKTRGPDQEQFYFNENVKGRLQMHNSTSRVIYSLSTNPYVDEAYLITDPASQWSNFVVERGEGQLASGVRIRNVFNNRCLTSKGGADPTFMECRRLNGNQFFSLGGPELARPPPRNIKPSRRGEICLQLEDDDYIGNSSANKLVFHPCATRSSDQERFYANIGLEGLVQMINTTSGATHVLSTNPYLTGAFIVANSRDDWSNFLVEVGQGKFADFVRFRHALSNQCLNFNSGTNPTFSECVELDFDQFFSFDIPTTPRPPPRTISPSIANELCLQLRGDELVDNNVASLLTFATCGTGEPDQERFYLEIGVAGNIEMRNTTSSTTYSLSTNPHITGAYVINHPPDDWSDFTVEEGTGSFADQVRIRNAFNDRCLRSEGNADAVFSACEACNADQYFITNTPLPSRPSERLRPSKERVSPLRLGNDPLFDETQSLVDILNLYEL